MVKLLYVCSNEWGNLGRRKNRLAFEFSQIDGVDSILFVNPPVDTSFLDILKDRYEPSHLGQDRQAHLDAFFGRTKSVNPGLKIFTGSTKSLPLTRNERLRRSKSLNSANRYRYKAAIKKHWSRMEGRRRLLWLSHPLQAWYLDEFSGMDLVCYDWTDDWTQYSSLPVKDRQELVAGNDRILTQADLIFAVSERLISRARQGNPNAFRAPNATDFELLSPASEPGELAADLEAIPEPRLGYIGQIGENIDYDLIQKTAEGHPEWSWVFVGPTWATREAEITRLDQLANVHFLGGRPHSQLVKYLRGFDICVMPHLDNPLTRSMDPTKLYDYLASGKPIVSTRVAGTERFGESLYLGDDPTEFERAILAALTENADQRQTRLNLGRENSWPTRAAEIWGTIRSHLP